MESTDAGAEIEQEWRLVDRLLSQKSDSASTLALIEAQKIFAQVLDEISYGPTIDEKIRNSAGLFGDFPKVLAAQNLYSQVLTEVGFVVSSRQAKQACDAMLAGLLDLVGRDYEPRGAWPRLLNSLDFFWGHHPRFLVGAVLTVLGFVAVVWFLVDTAVGVWVSQVGVGFARFVIERPIVMGGLALILVIGWILGRPFGRR